MLRSKNFDSCLIVHKNSVLAFIAFIHKPRWHIVLIIFQLKSRYQGLLIALSSGCNYVLRFQYSLEFSLCSKKCIIFDITTKAVVTFHILHKSFVLQGVYLSLHVACLSNNIWRSTKSIRISRAANGVDDTSSYVYARYYIEHLWKGAYLYPTHYCPQRQ